MAHDMTTTARIEAVLARMDEEERQAVARRLLAFLKAELLDDDDADHTNQRTPK